MKTATVYIRLPPELKKSLEKKALEMGLSVNALVIMYLNKEMKKDR